VRFLLVTPRGGMFALREAFSSRRCRARASIVGG